MGAVCQRRTIVRASVIEAPEIQMRWYKQAEVTGVSMSRKVPAENYSGCGKCPSPDVFDYTPGRGEDIM